MHRTAVKQIVMEGVLDANDALAQSRLRCASQGVVASALSEGALQQGYPCRGTTGSFGTKHAARQAARPVAVPRGLHRHHRGHVIAAVGWARRHVRSEEHTSELQSR